MVGFRKSRWIKGLSILLLFIALNLFYPYQGIAQIKYPIPLDPYISDYANVLTPADSEIIKQIFLRLQTEKNIEARVLTIDSIQSYRTGDPSIESFATNLFNSWKIGNSRTNRGVLLLVAISDRKMRIELGRGFGNAYDQAMQDVITTAIVPSFKNRNYSEGVRKGAEAIFQRFSGNINSSAGFSPRVPVLTPIFLGIGAIVIFFVVIIGGIIYAINRPLKCSKCSSPMKKLQKPEKDLYLTAGQKAEKRLGSVDYDVNRCSKCSHIHIKKHTKYSRFQSCPECGFATVDKKETTQSPATYSSTGVAEVTRSCRHCSYYNQDFTILPILIMSSSDSYSSNDSNSSGSSDSGGSSTGGGSSGDW